MFQHSLCSAIAGAILVSLGLHAAAAQPTAEDLAARAEALIDQYEGDPSRLAEAEKNIAASLEIGRNSHALVEKARLTLIRGAESPQSLQAAELLLQSAMNTDFDYGRTYVLQGYVYTKMGNLGAANQAFFKARRLAPTDPWFRVNYADYLQQMGDVAGARKYREELIASGTTNRKALGSAQSSLLNTYLIARDRPKADGTYAEIVRLAPANAWVRGDYAREVILWFVDFDAGQRHAEEALALMDYPHARQTLSLAHYGKWAAAKRDGKDPKIVLALLKEAQAYDPGAQLVPSCALDWAPLGFVKQSIDALGARSDKSRLNC